MTIVSLDSASGGVRPPSPLLAGPLALGLGLSLLTGPLAAAEAEPPVNGQWIEIMGQVTNRAGEALEDMSVVLTAHRHAFSLKSFEKRDKDFRRVEAVTGEGGEYRLRWLWDDYFNRFELAAGVRIPGPAGEQLHVLASQELDLARRWTAGSPIVVPLVVEDDALVTRLRRFEAALASDDERRIFGEMGLPDEVEVLDTPGAEETSWWYFDHGKVYRFLGGELREVASFDPVERFNPDPGEPEP